VPALARHRAERGADLPGLAAVARDVVAFCAELEGIRAEVNGLLEFVREENLELASTFHPDALLPFAPVSFRDFMLYEEHAIAAARGMVKRFMPGAWRFVSAYESVFDKLPARMRPKPIWYERPIYYMGSHINFFADGDTLPWPAYTSALDYELELGAVIWADLWWSTTSALGTCSTRR
jgi:2-keto-4-pentenoate hydratase/2-oxohepta-3-ene-1,7-dioic acid hydratase in catechol pathway